MDDDGLKRIATLTNLQRLQLVNFKNLTSKGLCEIEKLTRLSSLLLDNVSNVDDPVTYHIFKGCKSLQAICLRNANITKNSIGPICTSTALVGLNLKDCKKLASEDFLLLSKHPTLTTLLAGNTNLDDKFLKSATNLETIDVSGCPVTEKGVADFKAKNPQTKVTNTQPTTQTKSTGWFW